MWMVNPILFFFGLWVDLEVSIRGFAAGAQMPDALAAFYPTGVRAWGVSPAPAHSVLTFWACSQARS